MTGRTLGEGLARISFAAILAGVHLYAWPMFLAGLKGQPVDIQKFYDGLGLNGFNVVASIGAFVLLIGIVVGVVNVAMSYGKGTRAGHDPWGGATLEWFALSPPPPHNFDVVPDVRSGEPLHDIREAIRSRGDVWPRAAEPAPAAPEPEPEQTPEPAAVDARAGEDDAADAEGEAPVS
jgi:heme/copper-type cytochrome/quinol oxidase subunit 1